MRIVNWNINGLYTTFKDAQYRYSSVSNYFSQILHADIVCLQEAKVQKEKLEKWMACVPGYESFWAFSEVKKGYSGVVTYVKDELSALDAKADFFGDFIDDENADLCKEGRLVETDHGSFVLLNVYVPNGGDHSAGRPRLRFKMAFLRALKLRCDYLVTSGREVLIVGDFNIAHKSIDIYKGWNIEEIYSEEERAWMDNFFNDYVDLFRHFHPDEKDIFTNWDMKSEARIHNEGQRIDYAACSKGFLDEVIDAEIVKMVPKNWSDHASIVLTLKDQPTLPEHPAPAISSRSMKKFKEQNRITSFLVKPKPSAILSSKNEISNENQQSLCVTNTDGGDLLQRSASEQSMLELACDNTKQEQDHVEMPEKYHSDQIDLNKKTLLKSEKEIQILDSVKNIESAHNTKGNEKEQGNLCSDTSREAREIYKEDSDKAEGLASKGLSNQSKTKVAQSVKLKNSNCNAKRVSKKGLQAILEHSSFTI